MVAGCDQVVGSGVENGLVNGPRLGSRGDLGLVDDGHRCIGFGRQGELVPTVLRVPNRRDNGVVAAGRESVSSGPLLPNQICSLRAVSKEALECWCSNARLLSGHLTEVAAFVKGMKEITSEFQPGRSKYAEY